MPPNTVDEPRVDICQSALNACVGQPEPSFALAVIFRRLVTAEGSEGSWERDGQTCFANSVPTRSGEGVEELTEEMIIEQFHQTDFALPGAVIQPPDGRTLVNLPVYFALAWPSEGFEPQEIDSTTIIGYEVRIRPTLVGVTYVTGDGNSIGPTKSLGGPYPDGDITHEYADAADVAPYISVEYGGEVSVDGGDWAEIPSTVTVDGPTSPLEVLTSENRLYNN
ncbi:hypothetical protein [Serinicoccus sp. CNJ-927]|uniref:hypothetical protein n=1 Tax=Serinicoccus sp. CNJ-927 TaxID=1904970 RepID=UPI00117A2A8E|nr:hypothetical protein [Serinicoccus sp. CNJ-927]